MCDDHFKPYSNIYGIAGTSYRIQLGIKHNKWIILLLKAKIISGYHIFKDTTIDKLPERDRIVKWILTAIPFDIYPPHVIRTVTILMQKANENKEKKKDIPSIEDCIKVKENFKKIEDAKLKKPLNLGGVIEGKPHQAVVVKLRNALIETIENLERVISVLKIHVQEIFLNP